VLSTLPRERSLQRFLCAARDEFQIFVLSKLLCRDKRAPRAHRIMDQDAPAKFLDVPRNFRVRVSGVRRDQFHLCGISVEEYAITDLDFLAGSVFQSWGRHEFHPLWSAVFRFFLGFIGIPLVPGSAVAGALYQGYFAVKIWLFFGVELQGHAAGRSDAFQHRERVASVFGVL
jgi:hypothetical protein